MPIWLLIDNKRVYEPGLLNLFFNFAHINKWIYKIYLAKN